MNKRKFIQSLGALAVGCLMASGLCWRSEKLTPRSARKVGKVDINPEWANAKYEVRWITHKDAEMNFQDGLLPARSNNPNALRDKDFIYPFVTVDA